MTLNDIKLAILTDEHFRSTFPEYKEEITSFLNDPDCSCNKSLLFKIKNNHPERVIRYKKDIKQDFEVINCKVDELETRLRKIKRITGQIAICRYQDDVTVVIRYSS